MSTLCTKEEFETYIQTHMRSINIAIERKAGGSECEEAYFLEHWEKLRNFFMETKVVATCEA